MSQIPRLFLLGLTLLLLPACGYHLAGSSGDPALPILQGARIRVTGDGSSDNPHAARLLQEKLSRRLGITGTTPAPGHKPLEIEVVMDKVERVLVLEDRTGLADLFRITIQAQPKVTQEGKPVGPSFSKAMGSANYNQRYASTPSRATRTQAEAEALDMLTESLAAILAAAIGRTQ